MMMRSIQIKENFWWSIAVLCPVGMASVLYIMFKRDFAKIHLTFSFSQAPLFVGEILLFYCMLCLACFWAINPPKPSKPLLIVSMYAAWLTWKVAEGYHHWGPLAFRHAALFYYPFFAVIGFIFFNKNVLARWRGLAVLGLILAVLAVNILDHYWIFTLICLAAVLILKIRKRTLAYILTATLFLVIPYERMFNSARMMYTANVVSVTLLIAGIWVLMKSSRWIKMGMTLAILVVFVFTFYKFYVLGESGRVFVSPVYVATEFKNMTRDVPKDEKSNASILSTVHHVGLYNPKGLDLSVHATPPSKTEQLENGTENTLDRNQVKSISVDNIVFRLVIWRDMINDWNVQKPVWGVDLGKPFLSPTLVALHWAEQEWRRDGWIEPHNSYLNILYRAGIVGIMIVVFMWAALIWLVKAAFQRRSWTLVFMAAVLLNWMVAAAFLLILELPYTAIPFWTLAGMTFACACKDNDKSAYETKR